MPKSFTLLELIVVMVIIGILAGISLPLYYRSKERALAKEAIATLKLIGVAERNYVREWNTYACCFCFSVGNPTHSQDCNHVDLVFPWCTGCNVLLKLNIHSTAWNYYAVVAEGLPEEGGNFTALAFRKNVSPNPCQYRYDDSDMANGRDPQPAPWCP